MKKLIKNENENFEKNFAAYNLTEFLAGYTDDIQILAPGVKPSAGKKGKTISKSFDISSLTRNTFFSSELFDLLNSSLGIFSCFPHS